VLSALTGQAEAVDLTTAAGVEMRCLEALGWRLGPYFCGQDLPEDAEELASLFCFGGGGGGGGGSGGAGGGAFGLGAGGCGGAGGLW
jgi:hypothetical protein